MFDEVMLTVIAIATASIAVRGVWPITKKRHFKLRLFQTKRELWNTEFKKEKMKSIREGIRREYDRLNETDHSAKKMVEMEKEKEKPDKAVIEKFKGLSEKYKADLEYMKTQMEALDNEIDGETNQKSIQQEIEAYRSLIEMLKEFIRKL